MPESLEKHMEKTIRALREELAGIRAGRAHPALLDAIEVDYYGSRVPLKQVASISAPEPRLLVIQPWERQMIEPIEKAILASDLGLTPSNDGAVIRLQMPELTEERRRELVKQAHQLGEKAKIALRNIRREANEEVRRRQKEGEISEDEARRELDRIQKTTDRFVAKVDELVAHKERDILSI